jgi:hypothetical protein
MGQIRNACRLFIGKVKARDKLVDLGVYGKLLTES